MKIHESRTVRVPIWSRRSAPCWVLFALLAGPAALWAAAPVVDDMTASPAVVAPGATATISVEAHDPDCAGTCTSGCGQYILADLTYWEADGGTFVSEDDGSFGSPYTASADWQAPATEATYTITVNLADSGGFLCGGRQWASASVTVLVSSVISDPPVIDQLSADPARLLPNGTSEIECHATDPEGTPVSYDWETTSGTLGGATPTANGGSRVSLTGGDPGVAVVSCTATDADNVSTTSSVNLSVSEALSESAFGDGLVSPQRLAVDSLASVYVVDPVTPGLSVFNLFTGEPVYRLPLATATAVAVDWMDRILVGVEGGGKLYDRNGVELLDLQPAASLGDVSDVAVDGTNQLYALLYRKVGRIVIFNASGARVASFGSTGDDPEQFKSPQGLAVTPEGKWVVADSGHDQVKIFSATGTLEMVLPDASSPYEFTRVADVGVLPSGIILASDSFQDWVLTFAPSGALRDVLGTYGDDIGQLKTASGLAVAQGFGRLIVASLNGSKLQVFRTVETEAVDPLIPIPQLSAGSLLFPAQEVGAPSVTRSVRLSNSGNALLGVHEVAVDGPFSQSNDCGPYLAPEEFCTVIVSSTLSEAGESVGTLRIATSAGGTLTVELAGAVENPALAQLDPLGIQFADTDRGAVSDPRPVTLSNIGGRTLSLLTVTVSANFAADHDCPALLAPGGSCNIQVSFAPLAEGGLSGHLSVTTNAPGSPHQVALSGLALEPPPVEISVGDVEVDEGEDPEAVFEISLTRESLDPVVVQYTTVAGTAGDDIDFTPREGTLSFVPGETVQQVAVPILDDDLFERERERFTLLLSEPANGVLADAEGEASIVDDELCIGPNLVRNAGAEILTSDDSVADWLPVAGTWHRVTGPGAAEGRAWIAGAGLTRAELIQEVDLSAFVSPIDRHEQWFAFEAWVRVAVDDSARLIVEYRNVDGEVLDSFDTGAITETAWAAVPVDAADTRLAPPGTRRVRIRLIGHHLAGGETSAQFDAVSFESLRALTVVVNNAETYEGDLGASELAFSVNLSCIAESPVRLDLATVASTARENEDFSPRLGSSEIQPGELTSVLNVLVFGDQLAEGHETLFLDIATVDPSDVVILDPRGDGKILDDDACARGRGYWKTHSWLWPTPEVRLGAVLYPQDLLLQLLDYGGDSATTKLAAELTAAKLNLGSGTSPLFVPPPDQDYQSFDVRQHVERADELLELYPLGGGSRSNPVQLPPDIETEMLELVFELALYNEGGCA